jgi:hypothetical protein
MFMNHHSSSLQRRQGRQFRRDIFPLGADMVSGVKEMALPKRISQILEMR